MRASGTSSGKGCSSAPAAAAGASPAAAGSPLAAAASGGASAAGAVSPDGLSPASSASLRNQTALLLLLLPLLPLPPTAAMPPNPKPRCDAATANFCSDLLSIAIEAVAWKRCHCSSRCSDARCRGGSVSSDTGGNARSQQLRDVVDQAAALLYECYARAEARPCHLVHVSSNRGFISFPQSEPVL